MKNSRKEKWLPYHRKRTSSQLAESMLRIYILRGTLLQNRIIRFPKQFRKMSRVLEKCPVHIQYAPGFNSELLATTIARA